VSRTLRTLFVVLAVLLLGVMPAMAAPPDGAATGKAPFNGVYIVQMRGEPAVAYTGGTANLAATKPGQGEKIDPSAGKVVAYVAYLTAQQDALLASVGGADKLYSYTYSFNGFAAKLTPAQAAQLRANPEVVAVTPDELREVDTSSTPHFLGLDAAGGLWSKLGGPRNAGDGIIIGIVDSGIWPESASFRETKAFYLPLIRRTGTATQAGSPTVASTKSASIDWADWAPIPNWTGTCETGEDWTIANCNQKLIGARYFNAAWGGNAGIDAARPWEYNSPRDYNGHGTHTSSTAGGNYSVVTTGGAAAFGPISGMAPKARVAMYKALWSTQDASTASGYDSDLVAAIDQAVADGVDVINYSISGSLTDFLDPAEKSFLYAADAGVFIAASAGNSGPTASTVAHPSPWITTVAAGTHNRVVSGSVKLGNGVTYTGASVAVGVGPAPFIDAEAAGLAGADANKVRLCYAATDNGGTAVLDPLKVAGKIVLCDRGTTARVNKSLAVKEAGGVGMVLVNTSNNSLNADLHSIPSVHLQYTDRTAVKTYAATPGATATINKAIFNYNAPAPYVASFSSRGPLLAGNGDLLKPDLIAPGNDILAAVAPPGAQGLQFNVLSGTSMSSPHVAGLAALLMELHPNWTPMMIKSALMTSGSDILDGTNTDPAVIFSQGAGEVQPNKAAAPGLVYNTEGYDWLAFLCGTTTGFVLPSGCSTLISMGYSTDPSDLNMPSIAIGDLTGIQTVKRTVTNVGSAAATYTAAVTGLTGLTVEVTPSSLTLNPGQSKSFTVKFTTTSAAFNTYVGGYLTWTSGTNSVRIPIVIQPVALAAPAEVAGTGSPISYDVTFGYAGPFTATARGLVAATVTPGTVADDPTDSTCSLSSPNAQLIPVTVGAGITYARFSLFDADVDPGSDLDLCVFKGTTQVGSSGSGGSDEEVNLLNPTAGSYTVVVQGWGVDPTTPSPFKLYTWLLDSAAAGNMTVGAPATATVGGTGTINLTFSGLTAGTKYLGSVVYGGTTGLPNPTIVRVDP
jgi:subtilisin family serine protease